MTDTEVVLAVLVLPLIVPTASYAICVRSGRERWPQRIVPARTRGEGGAYRSAPLATTETMPIPRVVRATAFLSFFLGQMFLPGLVLGVVSVIFAGAGILSIPGLFVAARTFAHGKSLLHNEVSADRIETARAAPRDETTMSLDAALA